MIVRSSKLSKLYVGDAVNAACDGLKRKKYFASQTLPFNQTPIESFQHENEDYGDRGFISQFHEMERIINEVMESPADYGLKLYFVGETASA
jgi:hypothetical protein